MDKFTKQLITALAVANDDTRPSIHPKWLHGCVISGRPGGPPIVVAGNKTRQWFQEGGCQTDHAEVAAFTKLTNMYFPQKVPRRLTVAVARASKVDGSPTISKPCKDCRKFLSQFDIKYLVYMNSPDTMMVEKNPFS